MCMKGNVGCISGCIAILACFAIALGDNKIKSKREKDVTEHKYLSDRVLIKTCYNKGAAFNTGEKYPTLVLLSSVVFTFVIALGFVLSLATRGNGMLKLGLGILLGGAFSNTYDRIKKGYVVDYLNFTKAPAFIKNIVFNISDFAIAIGALITVICGNRIIK